MEEHRRWRVSDGRGKLQGQETQSDEVKTSSSKPNKTEESLSKMPLRKKVNKKTPAKNKATKTENTKKPHDSLKDHHLKKSETDESSSDDKYLEDYSTGDSENDTSGSDDLSQEFSDEDKLMEYYERKLREHCLVGNVGSCSSDSNGNNDPPDDSEEPSNESLETNTIKTANSQKTSGADSQQTVGASFSRTKPAHGKEQKCKSLLTIPLSRRKYQASESNRATADKLRDAFYDHESSTDNDEMQSAKKVGEPSCSNVAMPRLGNLGGKSLGTTANDQSYDSNQKVIDYLNRMGGTGLSELKGKLAKCNKKEGASYQTRVDEIHNSSKAHILKNYVSSFANRKACRTKRKNIGKHNHSANSTSSSENELSGEELTKNEVVDRILTTSLTGNTERNLTNLMELWMSNNQTMSQ